MLNLIFKFHENAILEVLCLEVSFPIDRAIEKSLETQIPHQIFHVFSREEILFEVICKVINDSLKFLQGVVFKCFGNIAVEHAKIHVVCVNDFVK